MSAIHTNPAPTSKELLSRYSVKTKETGYRPIAYKKIVSEFGKEAHSGMKTRRSTVERIGARRRSVHWPGTNWKLDALGQPLRKTSPNRGQRSRGYRPRVPSWPTMTTVRRSADRAGNQLGTRCLLRRPGRRAYRVQSHHSGLRPR